MFFSHPDPTKNIHDQNVDNSPGLYFVVYEVQCEISFWPH